MYKVYKMYKVSKVCKMSNFFKMDKGYRVYKMNKFIKCSPHPSPKPPIQLQLALSELIHTKPRRFVFRCNSTSMRQQRVARNNFVAWRFQLFSYECMAPASHGQAACPHRRKALVCFYSGCWSPRAFHCQLRRTNMIDHSTDP